MIYIQYNILIIHSLYMSGEIDWGGITTEDDAGSTDQIDFSIDLVETAGIVLEEDGLEGGTARGEDALSILENPETRNFFIDELVEVSLHYSS